MMISFQSLAGTNCERCLALVVAMIASLPKERTWAPMITSMSSAFESDVARFLRARQVFCVNGHRIRNSSSLVDLADLSGG